MAFVAAQVSLLRDGGLPEDASINVWHFNTNGSAAADAVTIDGLLWDFYGSIQSFLAGTNSGVVTTKYYDLEDVTPRIPVYEGGFSFTPGATSFPAEVAVALSYRGAYTSGVNNARRRGRLFIGPLSTTAATVVGADARPSSSLRADLATAAEAMATDSATASCFWSVFSPTLAGPPPWSAPDLTAAFATAFTGWIDDAFDTQRRRGADPTTRTLWP